MEDYFRLGLGGMNFRDDPIVTRLSRGLGLFLKAPGWFLGPEPGSRAGTSLPRLAWDTVRGEGRLGSFMVVTHHFMSPEELRSERGQERMAACVFKAPVGSEVRSMCSLNAGGFRDAVYRDDQYSLT